GDMKFASAQLMEMNQEDIALFEQKGEMELNVNGATYIIGIDKVEVVTEDIPGWQVAKAGDLTVALDVNITEALQQEGDARELVSRLQKLRKDMDLAITDKIEVSIVAGPEMEKSILSYKNYICTEILAARIEVVRELSPSETLEVNDQKIEVSLQKI
ncbi:MAG TPA: isoleucine--tRNA ligase, partial [Bacteroidetes bacterium]|nr:isoleucine--tRNA ligase [Bacteroidota bacterium]